VVVRRVAVMLAVRRVRISFPFGFVVALDAAACKLVVLLCGRLAPGSQPLVHASQLLEVQALHDCNDDDGFFFFFFLLLLLLVSFLALGHSLHNFSRF